MVNLPKRQPRCHPEPLNFTRAEGNTADKTNFSRSSPAAARTASALCSWGICPVFLPLNTKEKHPLLVTLAKDQFQRALGSSLVLPPLQPTQSIRQGLCIVKLYLIADIPSCLVPVSCSLSPSLAPSFSLSPHPRTQTHARTEGAPPSPNRCRER